jgi:hypothetical protein
MEIYNGTVSGDLTAKESEIYGTRDFSYGFSWTGTLNGILSLLASNDRVNWVELPGSAQSTQGTPGTHLANVTDAAFMLVKPIYTHVSGSGNLTINYYYK